jgi:CRP/FNR family transcriptional regulator, cyclic AMP receptor protein
MENAIMTEIHVFDRSKDAERVKKGDILFREGDHGDFMYAILEGEVSVDVGEKHIYNLGAGSVVGEMALIDPGPRSATVTVITDEAKVVKVDTDRFKFMVSQTPNFALQLMAIVVDRLRYATEHSLKSV